MRFHWLHDFSLDILMILIAEIVESHVALTNRMLRFERKQKGWQKWFDFCDAWRMITFRYKLFGIVSSTHLIEILYIVVSIRYQIPNEAQEQPW